MQEELQTEDKMNNIVEALKSHEVRIEHNFHALLQLSILVEFLYDQLERNEIKIDLAQLEEFQKQRANEIEEAFNKAKANPEFAKQAEQTFNEISSKIKI
ncbi:hypothetical protein UFOVP724_128 [uncultured Caudovirales phage]|uniref:Uncharacterized protein n=1 Tax=uncultured Caudovirales phage TaxID=2100421 RepID=A0A6J5NK88_9CAUD|nr:hypothetical protein UFOVP724_128 [uncultured Caudovirales phage]